MTENQSGLIRKAGESLRDKAAKLYPHAVDNRGTQLILMP
jgi:hypothetical protein